MNALAHTLQPNTHPSATTNGLIRNFSGSVLKRSASQSHDASRAALSTNVFVFKEPSVPCSFQSLSGSYMKRRQGAMPLYKCMALTIHMHQTSTPKELETLRQEMRATGTSFESDFTHG